MRKEADVKDAVKQVLNKYKKDVWWFMPVPTGFGVQGVPDFICCVRGEFLGIETKFGKNGLTPHQIKQMHSIVDTGGKHMVINETNITSLEPMIEALIALEE